MTTHAIPRTRTTAFLILFPAAALFGQPDLVSRARKEADPQRALALYREAEAQSPADWTIPFSMGQLHKHKLKDCGGAVGPYERAMEKSSYREWKAIIEVGYCFSRLRRDDRIITTFEKFLAGGGTISDLTSREFLARVYARNGSPEKALTYANPGSVLWARASTKTIRLDWRIQLGRVVSGMRTVSRDRVRITLPPDRPYQNLMAWSVTEIGPKDTGLTVKKEAVEIGDNRYADLSRGSGGWPDQILLHAEVEQKMFSMFRDGGPGIAAMKDPASPLYEAAHLNPNNEYSLEAPAFQAIAAKAAGDGNPSVRTKRLLNFLRENFKYAQRRVPRTAGALAVLGSGQGDCGYFSMLAMSLLRTQEIPVRRVYGVNLVHDGGTHVIIEIYDASTGQWFPTDPIISSYYGFINPMYVVFSSDVHVHGTKVIDGLAHIDTPRFRWEGSAADRMDFSILVGGREVHSSKKHQSGEDLEPSEKRPISSPDE